MSRATDLLDSQQFGLLVELREQLWSSLRLSAHGHAIELAHPDALDVADGMVWAELRHRREGDEDDGYTHALALMPDFVLRRADEARMRVKIWQEVLGQVFDPARNPEELRRVMLTWLDVRTVAKTKRFTSERAIREAYGCDSRFGSWVPIPDLRTEAGESAEQVVDRVMAELRQIHGAWAWVEAVPRYSDDGTDDRWVTEAYPGSGMRLVLRLIVWEERDGTRSIRDIKEQEACMVPAQGFYRVERIEPYLRGWASALELVLRDADPGRVEGLMPYDLVFPEVMALARPRTMEDFRDAMLVPSRLGALRSNDAAGDAGDRS